jgi:hypothetical protein
MRRAGVPEAQSHFAWMSAHTPQYKWLASENTFASRASASTAASDTAAAPASASVLPSSPAA